MSDEEYEPVELKTKKSPQIRNGGRHPGSASIWGSQSHYQVPPPGPRPRLKKHEPSSPISPNTERPPAPPPLSTLPHKSKSRTTSAEPSVPAPPIPKSPRLKVPAGCTSPHPSSPTATCKPPSKDKPSTHSIDHGMQKRVTSPEGEVLSLSSFVSKYSRSLPLRVRVDKGFCGAEERFVISSGDVYNIHFLKRTKVVSVFDLNRNEYTIPLNSAMEFGMLYDSGGDTSEMKRGIVFKTAGDILALCQNPDRSLPKIVCAMKYHLTGDPKSSVKENELLLIRRMGRTTVKRKPVLKVYSLTTKEEKTLSEDCAGHFTTDPYRVRLYPPEILAHFSDLLPLKSMLFISAETSEELPIHLTSDIITLTHTITETSLIATTCWEGGIAPTDEDRVPVDIPIDLDIEVVIIPVEGNEQLFMDTRNLYEGFDPSKVLTWKDTKDADKFTAQTRLRRVVRSGYEKEGLELQKPEKIYDVPTTGNAKSSPIPAERMQVPTSVSETTNSSSTVHSSSYSLLEKPAVPIRSTTPDSKPPQKASSDNQQLASLQAGQKSLKALLDAQQENSKKQIDALRENIAQTSATVESLSRELKQLQDHVKRLTQQPVMVAQHNGSHPIHQPVASKPTEEDNREYLQSLSPIQV